MSSLNQIVTILAENVGKQYDLVFKRELKTIVGYWRATILRQALKDNPRDVSYFQISWIMEVQRDYKVKCPFNYGCVMRTIDRIPQVLRNGQSPLQFVGSPDLETAYTYVFPNQLATIQSSRNIKKSAIYYTILDGYGYFYNMPQSQKYIGLQDIPTDLDKVTKYKKCEDSNQPCYTDDLNYPLTEDLVQRLIQAILATELRRQVPPTSTEVTL